MERADVRSVRAVVTVPAAALSRLLDLVEITEFGDWSDENDRAYKVLCLAVRGDLPEPAGRCSACFLHQHSQCEGGDCTCPLCLRRAPRGFDSVPAVSTSAPATSAPGFPVGVLSGGAGLPDPPLAPGLSDEVLLGLLREVLLSPRDHAGEREGRRFEAKRLPVELVERIRLAVREVESGR